ncbi:MAG: hypothetical protein NTW96_24945, partial [Planctomycetia bacterium]|nr:hypothetical protein [Planctomycetia bacterium]
MVTTVGVWTYDEDSSEAHCPDGTWTEDDTVTDGNVATRTTDLESHSTGREDGVGDEGSQITKDTQYDRAEDQTDHFDLSQTVHAVHALDDQTTVTTQAVTDEDGTNSWSEAASEDSTAVYDDYSDSSSHLDTSDIGSGDYTAASDVTTVLTNGEESDKWGYSDYSGGNAGTLTKNSSEDVRTTRGPYQNGNVTRTIVANYNKTDSSSGSYSITATKNITYVDPSTTQYEGGSNGTIDTSGTGSETKSLTYVRVTDTYGDHYHDHVVRSESRSTTDTIGHTAHKTYLVTLDASGTEGTPVEDVTTTETTSSAYTKTFEENGTYTGTDGSASGHSISIPGYGDPLSTLATATEESFDTVGRTWHTLDEESVTKGETVTTHNGESTRSVWREETTHNLEDREQIGDNHDAGQDWVSNEHYEDTWHLDRTHTEHRNIDGSGYAHDVAEFAYHRPGLESESESGQSSDYTSGSGESYYHVDDASTDDRTAQSEFYVEVHADGSSLTTTDDYSHDYDTTSVTHWANFQDSGWSSRTIYNDYSRGLVGSTMHWTSDWGETTDSSSWGDSQSGSYPATVVGNYALTVDGPETWSAFFSDVADTLDPKQANS